MPFSGARRPMPADAEHPREYLLVLLRYRRLMAAVSVGVLGITCIATLLETPLFKASSLIRMDGGRIQLVRDVTVDESHPEIREFYGTQKRLLTSRTLARRTLDRLDLWDHPLWSLKADATFTSLEAVANRKIDRLLELLHVTHLRDTQLMEVSFITPDPELSQALSNALASEYIAYNAATASGVARNTSSFISEQIEKLQRDIQRNERLLQQYGAEQDVVLEQSDAIIAQQLSELHHELTQAQSRLAAAEARYNSLRNSDPASSPEVFNNATIQQLREEHARLSKEYAELGAKYRPGWPEMKRLKRAIEDIGTRLEAETRGLADKLRAAARVSLQEARNHVALLEKTLGRQRAETRDINSRTANYNRIKVELESQQDMLQQLTRRGGETGLSAELEQRQHISANIVEDAVLPRKPYKPSFFLRVLAGAFVATILAPGLAFFLNFWDTAIRSSDDLKRYVSTPCLVAIPHFARERRVPHSGRSLPPTRNAKASTALARAGRPHSGCVDASKNGPDQSLLLERFKFLRNAFLMSSPGRAPRTVLLTSGSEREGKSFVSSNFASSFAQLDKRVLLVDADLRRPTIHRLFGLRNVSGLSNVIIGQTGLEGGCVQATRVPKLYVLSAGSRTPTPAELLSSQTMAAVLARCADLFDLVVIDSPPLFPVVDSHALAGMADTVMLVARSGSTHGPAVRDALELLEQSRGNVAGIVLNDVDLTDFAQSYYYRHQPYVYAPESHPRTWS